MLERIQKYFGVGSITVHSKNAFVYRVHSIKNLQVIINHFDKYPLVSCKLTDYLLFRRCIDLIKQKEHLTLKGLANLLEIKSNLNLGLSPVLKEAFPGVKKPEGVRDNYLFKGIPNPF